MVGPVKDYFGRRIKGKRNKDGNMELYANDYDPDKTPEELMKDCMIGETKVVRDDNKCMIWIITCVKDNPMGKIEYIRYQNFIRNNISSFAIKNNIDVIPVGDFEMINNMNPHKKKGKIFVTKKDLVLKMAFRSKQIDHCAMLYHRFKKDINSSKEFSTFNVDECVNKVSGLNDTDDIVYFIYLLKLGYKILISNVKGVDYVVSNPKKNMYVFHDDIITIKDFTNSDTKKYISVNHCGRVSKKFKLCKLLMLTDK